MAPDPVRRVRFGPFEADVDSGELRRDGQIVPLQDLPFRLLAALLERPGEVVSRADLAQRLWGSETFVDATAGLNTAVAKLRDALGDPADEPRYIETLPKRGYRFAGRVEPMVTAAIPEPVSAAAAAPAAPPPARLPWVAGVIVLIAITAALTASRRLPEPRSIRVAVVLFDNETRQPELASFAQGMTDATVTGLTAQAEVAAIGNAAALRTTRPFRDIARIRDAVGAHYLVLGQVQARDGGLIVRTHLIRAADEAHVWVETFPRGSGSEAAFQAHVSDAVRRAVVAQIR
jgi:DNA-binding winged helix-turn-helix (wHTH) protein/TolB-like protein